MIRHVESGEELAGAVAVCRDAGVCGVDFETTGPHPRRDRVRLVQLAVPGGDVWVADARLLNVASPLVDLFGDARVLKVLQHASFDLKFLRAAGVRRIERLFDTMLASQLLACGLKGSGHGLGVLVKRWLGQDLDKALQKSDFGGDLSGEQLRYAAADAAVLVPLYEVLADRLKCSGLVRTAKLEFDVLPAVADMEYAGIYVDADVLRKTGETLRSKRDRLAREVALALAESPPLALFPDTEVPINPASPLQVKRGLARLLGRHVPDTNETTLKFLSDEHPVIEKILEFRKLDKLLGTYIDKLPGCIDPSTGRVHCEYMQCATASGRFSCRGPNIQNVPRGELRSAFRGQGENVLVIGDLSQIELRIVAVLSKDTRMLDAYRRGEDLHRLTASLLTGKAVEAVSKEERQAAKAVNFGLAFGMSENGLRIYARDSFGVRLSAAQARKFRRRYFEAYAGVASWQRFQEGLRETRTRGGRLRRFADGRPKPTELYNTPVQGTGADIIKRAMARLRPRLMCLGAEMVASVHDEILVECAPPVAQAVAVAVREEMEAAGREFLPEIPVEADVCIAKSWVEKS